MGVLFGQLLVWGWVGLLDRVGLVRVWFAWQREVDWPGY